MKDTIAPTVESIAVLGAGTMGHGIAQVAAGSLSITEIAKTSKDPRRIVGMHFFNPVHLMRLVEIIVGKATADETIEAVREVGRLVGEGKLGKKTGQGFHNWNDELGDARRAYSS